MILVETKKTVTIKVPDEDTAEDICKAFAALQFDGSVICANPDPDCIVITRRTVEDK